MKPLASRLGGPARSRLVWVALQLLLYSLPLCLLAFSPLRLVDDAYISFRFADRLAHGAGFSFNDGVRVEGVSNLGWTMLLALVASTGRPLEAAAVVLGVGCALLALAVTHSACRRLGLPVVPTMAALLGWAALPQFWRAMANGLEGGLFVLLFAWALRGQLLGDRPWRVGLLGGSLALVRPESVLLLLPFLVDSVLPRRSEATARSASRQLPLVWLGIVAATSLGRLLYFGSWVPNPVLAKAPPAWSIDLAAAHAQACLVYYGKFLLAAAPLTFGAALALAATQRPRSFVLLWGALVAPAPAIFVNGGDWMQHSRLLAIYTPALAIAAAQGLAALADRLNGVRRTLGTAAPLLLTLGGLALAWRGQRPLSAPSLEIRPALPCWSLLAEALEPRLERSDLLAPEAIGVFAYRLPRVAIHDLLGLTDPHIAREGREFHSSFGTADPAYTYSLRPTLILVHSGEGHLAGLRRLPGDRYRRSYATFALRSMPPGCAGSGWLVGVRRDAIARLRPALDAFGPELGGPAPIVHDGDAARFARRSLDERRGRSARRPRRRRRIRQPRAAVSR